MQSHEEITMKQYAFTFQDGAIAFFIQTDGNDFFVSIRPGSMTITKEDYLKMTTHFLTVVGNPESIHHKVSE